MTDHPQAACRLQAILQRPSLSEPPANMAQYTPTVTSPVSDQQTLQPVFNQNLLAGLTFMIPQVRCISADFAAGCSCISGRALLLKSWLGCCTSPCISGHALLLKSWLKCCTSPCTVLVWMLHTTMHLSHSFADTCLLGRKGALKLAEAIRLHGGSIWTPASTKASDRAVVLVTAELQSPDLCDVPPHITEVQTTTVDHVLVSISTVCCAADMPHLGLVNAYAVLL